MEQANTLATVTHLQPLVRYELQVADAPCHIAPEDHSAIVVNTRPGILHVLYRCQLKWWQQIVEVRGDGTSQLLGREKVCSALGSPAGAAKKLAAKSSAFKY